MKYFKNVDEYILNELIKSRKELIDIPESEIMDSVEPALMTQNEYLRFINKSGKSHDDNAYDFNLSGGIQKDITKEYLESLELVQQKQIGKVLISFYLDKKDSTFGYYKNPDADDYKDKAWTYYTDSEKTEKGLPLFSYDVVAVHNDEMLLVGSGQDEWGCVLIWALEEYRGMGIGEEIVKIYRKYYPSKDSGGFTSFGYNQAKKYHAHLVRKYLSNGIYSDMVKKGEITKKKAKEIIVSIKDTKRFSSSEESTNPLAKYYGDSGDYSLYIDDRFVLIYDTKLLQNHDLNLDYKLEDLVYDKTIKAFISHREDSDGDFSNLFSMYSENKKHFKTAMDITLSLVNGLSNKYYFREEEKHNVKELPWIQEFVKDGEYYIEKYNKYEHDNEIFDIVKIKTPIPEINAIKTFTQNRFKQKDPYDIKLSTIIEKAEGKTRDYIEENRSDYHYNKAIDAITKDSRNDIDWFKNNFKHSENFVRMFQHYYGDEWENTSKANQSIFQQRANDVYRKLVDELGLYE